jgi:hypothetical protein
LAQETEVPGRLLVPAENFSVSDDDSADSKYITKKKENKHLH